MIIVSLLTLTWIFINIQRILIKQRKYKVLPLVSFYTSATLNVFLRLSFVIWYFKIENQQLTIFLLDVIATNFMIGIDQTWINIELCLIINHSLKLILNPTSRPIFPIRCIKIGRIAIFIFTVVFFITINSVFIALSYSKENLGNFVLDQFSDFLQITDFCLLTLTIGVLMYYFNKFKKL